MDNKRFNNIWIVFWGMIFCFNLSLCLLNPNPHPISWVCTGVALGSLVMLLIITPLMNVQNNLIKALFKSNKRLLEISKESIEERAKLIEKLKKKNGRRRT